MTFDETLEILATISSVDNRKFTDMSPETWHEIIGDLPYGQTRQAVIAHFRTIGAGYLSSQLLRERVLGRPENTPLAVPLALAQIESKLDLNEGPTLPREVARQQVYAAVAAAKGPVGKAVAETLEQIETRATENPHPFDDAPLEEG